MQERLYSVVVKENAVRFLCLVAQSCPTLCDPKDCSPPGFSVHGDSPCKNSGVVAMPSSRRSSQPGDRTEVSGIAGRFFTDEPTGKLPLISYNVTISHRISGVSEIF